MVHDHRNLRATLDQIERLMADAERDGAPFPAWLDQLAIELRATLNTGTAGRSDTARRMRADPAASLDAQAHIDAAKIQVLKS